MSSPHNEEENIELLKLNDSDSGQDSDTETSSSSSSSRPRVSRQPQQPKEYVVDGVTYSHEQLYPTLWGEVKAVAGKYKQILLATLVLVCAMSVTAVQFTHKGGSSVPPPKTERYVPPAEDQRKLSAVYRMGISSIGPEDAEDGGLYVQNLFKGDEMGHKVLPRRFYEGVHVGISNWEVRRFVEELLSEQPSHGGGGGGGGGGGDDKSPDAVVDDSYLKVLVDKLEARPGSDEEFMPPSSLYDWNLYMNTTAAEWATRVPMAKGKVLFFSFKEMEDNFIMTTREEHGMTTRDYSRVIGMAEKLGRELGCLTIHLWYPHQFGKDDDLHINILQEVRPIRSGLQNLKSSGAVWMRDEPRA